MSPYWNKEDDMIEVISRNGTPTLVCPDCKDHIQDDTNTYDCKNLYKIKEPAEFRGEWGQCGCWSREHGVRIKSVITDIQFYPKNHEDIPYFKELKKHHEDNNRSI